MLGRGSDCKDGCGPNPTPLRAQRDTVFFKSLDILRETFEFPIDQWEKSAKW